MKLLDTCVVSAFLKSGRTQNPKLREVVTAVLGGEGFAIAFVTQWELRRGIEELVRRGEGRRKLIAFEKFIDRAEVLGLDAAGGEGWNLAARLWADAGAQKPAVVISDADLLIAATAAFHDRTFVTSDARLAKNLERIGVSGSVELLAVE